MLTAAMHSATASADSLLEIADHGLKSGREPYVSRCDYWLPKDVYICATEEAVIFLDVDRDRYFGVAQSPALARVLGFELPQDFHCDGPVPAEEIQQVVESLLDEGLLTRSAHLGKPLQVVSVPRHAGLRSARQDQQSIPRITFGHIFTFVRACLSAAWDLRWHGLGGAVSRAMLRSGNVMHMAAWDTQRAGEIAAVFSRLRLFVFSADGKCLYHALALVHFCARYQLFPSWVIGVKDRPFAAHSWVQYGDLLLDTTPELVAAYVPILAV